MHSDYIVQRNARLAELTEQRRLAIEAGERAKVLELDDAISDLRDEIWRLSKVTIHA